MKTIVHHDFMTRRYLSQQGLTGNGTSRYLSLPVAVAVAPPISLFCWFKVASAVTQYMLLGLDDNATDAFTPGYYMQLSNTSNGTLDAQSCDGASAQPATTANTFTANTWNSAGAAFDSNSLRRAYLNRGAGASNTNPITPTGIVSTKIGKSGATSAFINGTVAWPFIWKTALTAQEFSMLSTGFPPWLMHPESIISGVLCNELTDPFQPGFTWTNNAGMTLTTPPTVIRPAYVPRSYRSATAVVPGTGSSVPRKFMHYQRQRRVA